MHRRTTALLVSTLVALCAPTLHAGPLTPPPGPVAPTPGPEPRIAVNAANTPGDATSLFRINQPGSYFLTGNITGVVGKNGIGIAASGVTIDLNGFDLVGVAGSVDGVSSVIAGLVNISVTNGSVRNWGDEGIDFVILFVTGGRVERVVATGNAGSGIFAGKGFTISGCSSHMNVVSGISVGEGSTITHCSAAENGAQGIAMSNGGAITDCSSLGNGTDGFFITTGSTIERCTARLNGEDGIFATIGGVVRGNICTNNGQAPTGGAGVHANGSDNRIEGNTCTGADRGIDVDLGGNFIARNICTSNTTNWDIAANNVCLVVVAANAGAINGNSGGVAPGSTDPNANFTY